MPSTERCTIRRLGSGCRALMAKINTLFGAVFEEPAPYGGARPSPSHLADPLGAPTFIALAAHIAERLVGALVAYDFRKFEQERGEINIYDLAVCPEWRRQGIATALIEAVKPKAGSRGAHVIFIQADRGNSPAIALYEKMGRREVVLHFDISVD